MIIFVKDEDDVLVIPVGLGPNVGNIEGPVFEDITLDSSTMEQIVTPEIGVDGFSKVTVNPYELDSKAVDSSTVSQVITSDVDGLSSVIVNPVTAAIDPNIQAENIKLGVSILGVTGTYGEPVSFFMSTAVNVYMWYTENEYGWVSSDYQGNCEITIDDDYCRRVGCYGLAGATTQYWLISPTAIRFKLNDDDWTIRDIDPNGRYSFDITIQRDSVLTITNGHVTQTINLYMPKRPAPN